jgi:hypothetical protein
MMMIRSDLTPVRPPPQPSRPVTQARPVADFKGADAAAFRAVDRSIDSGPGEALQPRAAAQQTTVTPASTDAPDRSAAPQAPDPLETGLGDDVDSVAENSPSLQRDLRQLKDDGWKIEYGEAGKGSYTDRDAVPPKIVIDGNERGNPNAVTQTLAHEVGHATYSYEIDDSSKQAYVNSLLADEGAATLNNIKVQREILANGGPDIGIAGNPANHQAYNDAYDQFVKDKDEASAREKIGAIFGEGEHPSTAPEKTYAEYYGAGYDQSHPLAYAGRLIGEGANFVADGAGELADRALDATGDFANWALDQEGKALSSGGRLAGEGITAVVDGAGKLADSALDATGKFADRALDEEGKAIDETLDRLGIPGGDQARTVFDKVGDGIAWVEDKAGDGVKWVADKAGDGAKEVLTTAGDSAGKALDKVGDGVAWIDDKAGDAVKSVTDKAGDGAKWVAETAGAGAQKAVDKVGEGAKKVIDFVNPFD